MSQRTKRLRGMAIALPLALAGSAGFAQPLGTQLSGTETEARIFQPPPLQWDNAMLTNRPALPQTATDFANLTGGIAFGMTPTEVNAWLPDPDPGLAWSALPEASEYPGEVRYFWSRMDGAGALRLGVTACTGSTSYVVFLFGSHGLFRLSYRLVPDQRCPRTTAAARDIFARYVPIGSVVALSAHYRTGTTEVVDVTDSTAGYLIPTRWRQGLN